MAGVITKVEVYEDRTTRFTCASNAAIAKGTLLQLTDPRTVTAHSGTSQSIVGIAAQDKSATDYSTSISVWTAGIFKGYASGSITAGGIIEAGTQANVLRACTGYSPTSFAYIVGKALETAAEGEQFTFKLLNM